MKLPRSGKERRHIKRNTFFYYLSRINETDQGRETMEIEKDGNIYTVDFRGHAWMAAEETKKARRWLLLVSDLEAVPGDTSLWIKDFLLGKIDKDDLDLHTLKRVVKTIVAKIPEIEDMILLSSLNKKIEERLYIEKSGK